MLNHVKRDLVASTQLHCEREHFCVSFQIINKGENVSRNYCEVCNIIVTVSDYKQMHLIN